MLPVLEELRGEARIRERLATVALDRDQEEGEHRHVRQRAEQHPVEVADETKHG